MTEKPANTRKKTIPKNAWKAGQSGNPKGAPKRGESWAEIIKQIGELTPGELAEMLSTRTELGRQFKQMPQDIPMKKLIIARVCSALMFEPQPGLFNALMDRAEGKVTSPYDVTSAGEKITPSVIIFRDEREDSHPAAPAPDATDSGSADETV